MVHFIGIGINNYDPQLYGNNNNLTGCVTDIQNWLKFIRSIHNDVKETIFLNHYATSKNVLTHLYDKPNEVRENDIIILAHSGHGTQLPDFDNDESDKKDEAYCFYDTIVKDDIFKRIWERFPKNLNIVVVTDTCHSGTIYREKQPGKPKYINTQILNPIEADTKPPRAKELYNANFIFLSACADNQVAQDLGPQKGGAFTYNLLKTARNMPNANYYQVFKACLKAMPPDQTPQFTPINGNKIAFTYNKFCQ